MNKDCLFSRFVLPNRVSQMLLIVVSVSGLLIGIFLAETKTAFADFFFRSHITASRSLLSLIVLTVPVAVVCVALKFRSWVLSYLTVLFIFICRGFCGMLLHLAIGDSAWLIRDLLMFSANAFSVLICWLLYRHCNGMQASFVRDLRIVSVFISIVFIFDFLVISPLLSSLFKYF